MDSILLAMVAVVFLCRTVLSTVLKIELQTSNYGFGVNFLVHENGNFEILTLYILGLRRVLIPPESVIYVGTPTFRNYHSLEVRNSVSRSASVLKF